MKNSWLILAAVAAAAWWILRKQEPMAPVEIGTLRTETGTGPSAEESVSLFDQLFGLRDAQSNFSKLSSVAKGLRTQSCHSDGSCETYSVATMAKYPLVAPSYFVDFLGVNRY